MSMQISVPCETFPLGDGNRLMDGVAYLFVHHGGTDVVRRIPDLGHILGILIWKNYDGIETSQVFVSRMKMRSAPVDARPTGTRERRYWERNGARYRYRHERHRVKVLTAKCWWYRASIHLCIWRGRPR